MKSLIYYTSLGNSIYKEMTKESIKSLRLSNYTGDIAVLTDEAYDFGDNVISVIIKTSEYFLTRTTIHTHIDLSQYKNIMYMDSDIVAIKDITHLFNSDFDGVLISSDNKDKITGYNLSLLNEEEKIDPGIINTPSINTGMFIIPVNKVIEYFELWYKEWNKRRFLNDQPVFQLLATRKKINYKLIDEVSFPMLFQGYRDFHSMVHLCGLKREQMDCKESILNYMKMINESGYNEKTYNEISDFANEFWKTRI